MEDEALKGLFRFCAFIFSLFGLEEVDLPDPQNIEMSNYITRDREIEAVSGNKCTGQSIQQRLGT